MPWWRQQGETSREWEFMFRSYTSHLVSIPPGPHLLSEVIQRSPVLFDPERAAGPSGGDEGMGDFDASEDPELAMALRMSLQEAQEREERENQGNINSLATATDVAAIAQDVHGAPVERTTLAAAETAPLSNANDPGNTAPGDDEEEDDEDDEDEDAMMARAMAMSRGEAVDGDVEMGEDDDEDEEAAIARAIAMSLEENKEDKK